MTTYEEKVLIDSNITGSEGDKMAKHGSDLLNTACEDLLDAIKAFPHDNPPFVILSFDEIHALEEHYINFRRALHTLLARRVFSLFLSTAGHMYKFMPTPSVDRSARVVSKGWVVPPFSELGFDHFAKPIVLSGGDMLSRVSSTEQIVTFGRPLYVTRSINSLFQLTLVLVGRLDMMEETWPYKTILSPLPHRSYWVGSIPRAHWKHHWSYLIGLPASPSDCQ